MSLSEKIKASVEKTYQQMNKEQDTRLKRGENGFFPYHFVHECIEELQKDVLLVVSSFSSDGAKKIRSKIANVFMHYEGMEVDDRLETEVADIVMPEIETLENKIAGNNSMYAQELEKYRKTLDKMEENRDYWMKKCGELVHEKEKMIKRLENTKEANFRMQKTKNFTIELLKEERNDLAKRLGKAEERLGSIRNLYQEFTETLLKDLKVYLKRDWQPTPITPMHMTISKFKEKLEAALKT